MFYLTPFKKGIDVVNFFSIVVDAHVIVGIFSGITGNDPFPSLYVAIMEKLIGNCDGYWSDGSHPASWRSALNLAHTDGLGADPKLSQLGLSLPLWGYRALRSGGYCLLQDLAAVGALVTGFLTPKLPLSISGVAFVFFP
jgi:hypothetical protein